MVEMAESTENESNASGFTVNDLVDQPSPQMDKPIIKRPRLFIDGIEVPHLESRHLYRELDLQMMDDSQSNDPVEVLGEVRMQSHMFYWVLHENDVIYRHAARSFKNAYPDLLTAYTKAKVTGSLPEFDPQSTQIHPKHRIRLTINLPPPTKVGPPRGVLKTSKPKGRSKAIVIEDSSETGGSESASEDDYGEQSDWSGRRKEKGKFTRPTRQSNRNVTTTNYREPSLSPVKTRTRTRTSARLHPSAEEIEDEEEEYDELDYDSDGGKEVAQPKKKRTRGRLSRPAYGNIRLIADLSENESDDDYPLRVHRDACDKCQEPPAHISLNKYYAKLKRKTRGRRVSPNEEEEERLQSLGGWVRCLKCTVGIHWRCLSKVQRDEILKAAKKRVEEAEKEGLFPRRLETLSAYDTTDFFCGACIQGGICMYCKEVAVVPEESPELKFATQNPSMPETPGTAMTSSDNVNDPSVLSAQPTDTVNAPVEEPPRELLFRCQACKRLAHYAHFPQPDPDDLLSTVDLAVHYQKSNSWQCTDCISFVYQVDKILAWRPYPADATEPSRQNGGPVDYKALLPREYLVKWLDRSYRRVEWVPHMWLLSTSASKLKNFLATGPKVTLLNTPSSELIDTERDSTPKEQTMQADDPNFLIPDGAVGQISARDGSVTEQQGPAGPLPDAERRIPPAWRRVERILDIRIWNPLKRPKKRGGRSKRSKQKRVETESEIEANPEAEEQQVAAYELGQQPDAKFLETMDEWETRNSEEITTEQAPDVIWAYVKWSELGYEDATWDVPPRDSEPGYDEFRQAFERFLQARQVSIAKKSKKDAQAFDNRPRAAFEQKKLALTSNPKLGQKGKLMDFQLAGVNWLFRNWWRRQPSILADDMGLGKTVQISTFVGYLAQHYDACPILIVVPNSTVTNWLRELASWAPRVIVAPYYGDFKGREVIRRYELFHEAVHENYTRLKFHVLIATYESVSTREFSTLFKSVPRWELLIVDEAQRLKNDTSLLFKRLNELNSIHRILMTGTPLNNNIRELFNLMNFLDSEKWYDMQALENEYENITEEKLLKLHEDLKPYFLRRTKADVLKLPPKNEVIVPLSMSSLQKELYKSLLSKNIGLIQGLVHPSKVTNSSGKPGLRNMLMDLRKCLQHPYLVQPELEPRGPDLVPAAIHKNLVDASCKLRFLQMMLPKLKARGHRVLLFSQFVIALDIVEDFLTTEGYKFLRLDGNTKQLQRQKDMDVFNEPNSDYFIFMLSTRAGGVGINLWSADTVIIFDPDFNPHQDLQAISRAHRYGQEKPVLVFKFMVKGAAEERIMQTGKKKLALDHLIVQKMDEEDLSSDLQSILTFGAKALFDESENNDITYTDVDIEKLILRTEHEGDEVPEGSTSFGFAKLWTADKDVLEEIQEDAPQDQDTSFWDAMLAKVTEEQAKAKAAEVTGRGAKRRAATTVKKYVFDVDSPEKTHDKKWSKSRRSFSSGGGDDKAYSDHESSRSASAHQSYLVSDDEDDLVAPDIAALSLPPEMQAGPSTMIAPPNYKPAKVRRPKQPQKVLDNKRMNKDWNDDDDVVQCGLCQRLHGPGECFMSQNPLNLIEYRQMILNESTEPLEKRKAAIYAIDSHLASQGLSELIRGQGNVVPEEKVPGTSQKRKSSSPSHGLVIKKPRLINENRTPCLCLICNGPYHLIKSCPVVKAGAESIAAAIQRLSSVPNSQAVINMLLDCLKKAQQQEFMQRY